MESLKNVIATHIDDTKGVIYTISIDGTYALYDLKSNAVATTIKLTLSHPIPSSPKLVAMNKDNIFFAYESMIIRIHVPSKKHKEYKFSSMESFTGITAIKFNEAKNVLFVGSLTGHLMMLNFQTNKIKLAAKLKDEVYNITTLGERFYAMTLSNEYAKPQLLIYNFINDAVERTLDLQRANIPTSATQSDGRIFMLDSNHDDLKYTSQTIEIKSDKIISANTQPGYNRNIKNAHLILDEYALISGMGKTIYAVNIENNEVALEYVLKHRDVIDLKITHRHIYIVLVDSVQVIPIFKHEENYIAAIKALEFNEAKKYMEKNKFLIFSEANHLLEEMWSSTLKEAIGLLKGGQKNVADDRVMPYKVFPKKAIEYNKYVKEVKLISDFSLLLQQKNTLKAINLLNRNVEFFKSVGIYDNYVNKWFAIFNKSKMQLKKLDTPPKIFNLQKVMGNMYHFNKEINNDLIKDFDLYLTLDKAVKTQDNDTFLNIYEKKPILASIPFYKKFFDNIDPLDELDALDF